MDSKLTLSINKALAHRAKAYARKQGRSLSDLVESYFKVLITEEDPSEYQVSEKLQSLKGALKVSEDFDYKAELSDSLAKKYHR